MGPTWDDRLTPLAQAFYLTAKAVTAMVGAGRFVGGALQLGKSKVQSSVDDLLNRWDHVLGISDDMLDQWLPEEGKLEKREKSECKGEPDEDIEVDSEREASEDEVFRMEIDEVMECKDKQSVEIFPANSLSPKQLRQDLFIEIGNLVLLPWNQLQQIGSDLRRGLSQASPSWFTYVDDVLLQNDVVRAISRGVMRPAEHFFTTAVEIFRSYHSEVETFLLQLQRKLGSTWDERLITPGKSFFNLAVDLTKKSTPSTSVDRLEYSEEVGKQD